MAVGPPGWRHQDQAVRRTLRLPQRAVEVLVRDRGEQEAAHATAGDAWQDHGLVFCSRHGAPLDAANVRRSLRAVVDAAGLDPGNWTPRELRHSFVSLMSAAGPRHTRSP